jgi:hypothetical protein
MTPAAVHYIARSAAYEVAVALASGRMPSAELVKWEAELAAAREAMPEHERREVLHHGSPSTHVKALVAMFR